MKKLLLAALVLLPLLSCTKKADEEGFNGNYAFGGSTTVEPIINAAIDEFSEIYPEVSLSYDSQGSSVGVKGALSGLYNLGATSRELKQSEIDEGAIAVPIALDGVAVVVNTQVPMDNISLDDLIAIYAGDITNWSELGGPDADIVVFNRDEASGTRSCFKDSTVKKTGQDFINTAAIVTSNGDMVSKVGATPFSIGYCGFGYLGKDSGTKALSVDEIAPEFENVLNGSYGLSRSLNVIYSGELEAGSLEEVFIDFLLSEDGQAIVEEESFIPVN